MPVDFLGRVVGGEGEGVERIVDTCGIERGIGVGNRRPVFERGEVEASGFLDGSFAVLGCGGRILFFFGEEGVLFGFLARRFLLLRFGLFPVLDSAWVLLGAWGAAGGREGAGTS